MDHHRHVDIVEMALGDEFGLAEQEFDLAPLAPPQALLDIDEFLGRHREKHDFAGEVLGRARRRQPHRDAEHAGDLGVVAAAVRRAGMRVGERVLGGAQAVELAEQRETRAGLAAAQPPLDPGQPEAGLRREAQLASSSRATSAAVRVSLKPVSGWCRIRSPSSMIALPWRSIASQTARFSSSRVSPPLVILSVPAMRASPMPDNAGRGARTAAHLAASRPGAASLQDFAAARPGARGGFGRRGSWR